MINLSYKYKKVIWIEILFFLASFFFVINFGNINAILIFSLLILGFEPLIRIIFGVSNESILAPNILIPLLYIFYAFGPIIGNNPFSSDIILNYLQMQLIGMIGLRLGMFLAFPIKTKCNIDLQKNDYDKIQLPLLLTACLLFLFSIPSIGSQIIAFGGFKGLISVGYGGERFKVLQNSFEIGGGFEWFQLSAILFWFYGLKSNNIFKYIGIFLYLIGTIILLLIGGRSTIVYTIIFIIVLYHFGHKKLGKNIFILGIILGMIFAQFYSYARYYLKEGLIYSFSKIMPFFLKAPLELLPFKSSEFKLPGASLLEILQYGGPGLKFGSSYLLALGSAIPFVARFFEKTFFNPSIWRLQTFHLDVFLAGGGLGYSPVTEGFINFGCIGVFLYLFLYGYIIERVFSIIFIKQKFSSLLFFAGSLPLFLFDGLRIHAASFIYKWTRIFLMPWFIYWLIIIFILMLNRKRC